MAFPSAADLFDVQSSFNYMIINNIQLKALFAKLIKCSLKLIKLKQVVELTLCYEKPCSPFGKARLFIYYANTHIFYV